MRVLFGEKCCLSAEKSTFFKQRREQNFDHDEHKLPSKLTSEPIRQMLAQ